MTLPNISNISMFFLLIGIIIGVFIGLYFRAKVKHSDGKLLIDQSSDLEKERWSFIFDTPMDEIEKKDYIIVRIEHKK